MAPAGKERSRLTLFSYLKWNCWTRRRRKPAVRLLHLPLRQSNRLGFGCGRGRFPRDPRRVSPQIFQTVKSPLVAVEDVDHDFEIIEHDPLACGKTVNGSRAQAVVFLQSRFDLVRDRFELRFRRSRANHEEVSEAGNTGQIENDDVFGLFVRGEFGTGRG